MHPLVSFIIPYYNNGDTIQETIDSIFDQTYKNFEIWIINDGSTDENSLFKLKELEKKINLNIIHQENLGPSIARNNAIKKTKATIIIPIDADDLIDKKIIENSLPLLLKNKKAGVAYGNLKYFGDNESYKKQAPFDIKKQLLFWNQIAICCLIKKEVFETVGYYDEFLSSKGLEDWEFWIRVHNQNWEFLKIEQPSFEIRTNPNSRTFQIANKNLDEIKEYVFKKHSQLLAKEYYKLYYTNKMHLRVSRQ